MSESYPVNPYGTIPDPEDLLQSTRAPQPVVPNVPDANDPVTYGMVQNGFNNFETVLKGITERINELANIVSASAQTPAVPPHPSTPPSTTPAMFNAAPRSPKFKEPTVFDGKGSKVEGFIQEISDALTLLRNTYTSGQDKCLYMASYLGDGTPREWYKSIRINNRD
ncbi:hypothetical protein EV361DRAFT_873425 [Lentinula raphanica]|nr:hypothetical protein EV361DRAFT_873425 [Lentinula raphanica]